MEVKDISFDYLNIIFEVTRFCNMECPHCIRGDAQKRRIKKDYINSVLGQLRTNGIGTITFSGGEPALAKDLINYTLDMCQYYNVDVLNFWMATNGTVTSPSFFNTIKNWLKYCSDNSISGLRISIDNYHDPINKYPFVDFEEELGYLGLNCYLEYSGAPSEAFLIGEGRAVYNYATHRRVEHGINLVDDGRIEGSLYINAKGFVISTCDISYDRMDNDEDFIICHVTDDIKEGIVNWFNKHPEMVECQEIAV